MIYNGDHGYKGHMTKKKKSPDLFLFSCQFKTRKMQLELKEVFKATWAMFSQNGRSGYAPSHEINMHQAL